MSEILDYLQVGSNGIALAIAGWIYVAYIKSLRASVSAKDEQIKIVEKHLQFWKDKASEFEKKTPEYIEEVLAKRIKHREEEITRLDSDNTGSLKLLASKNREVSRLKEELDKAKYFGRALTYFDLDSDEEVVIPESDIELEHLGEIFVDSASILITDPMYVEQCWREDIEYEDIRLYKYSDSEKVYQFGVDFDHYDSVIDEIGKSPNQLREEGKWIPIEVERDFTYSMPGAMYASSSKNGFAELKFEQGHSGAGICVRTVYGDGGYQVYGERYKGDLYRIYIELQ